MKENRLKNWQDKEELDCLLFFALRVRELVFDYTLDSFKYPALNVTSICEEAVELIQQIEEKNITEKSIKPVLDELIWKLKSDKIVKELIDGELDYYINFGDYSDLRDIKLKLEILRNKFHPIRYAHRTEKVLIKLIEENKEKRTISELAANYVTTLINIGYSQSFIYLSTNSFFFSNHDIYSAEQLVSFFDLFDNPIKTYEVVFKCSQILGEIEDSSESFGCLVQNELVDEVKGYDVQNFLKSKNSKELYFIANNIPALDPHSAKIIGEEKINKLSKLFVFYHHKEHPTWSEKALVINRKEKKSELINEKVSPMSKGRDLKPDKAARRLKKLIRGLKMESNSFAKYDRVIDLHGLSVENKNSENQLLQNWIAFETLLVGYSEKSKIDQVLENLTPFLKVRYLDNLIYELLKDVSRFDYDFFKKEIKEISHGNDNLERFTALITLDIYKENRIRFYKTLRRSPVIKFRLAEFHTLLSSTKKIKEYIERHERKVRWQIIRMYRSRNLLVHAGQVPDYTEILVENSHFYLDTVINMINELSIDKGHIRSIEQAIKEIQIIEFKHQKSLSQNIEKPVTKNNFLKIILNK